MKRGGPLQTYTRLERTTPLRQRSIKSAAKLAKKPRRTMAVAVKVKVALALRSGSRCEMALHGCTVTATDPAHRIKQGMGGRQGAAKDLHDVLSNVLHACRTCHSWTHARPAEAYELGLMLREHQTPTREPVVYRGELSYLTDDGQVIDFEAAGACPALSPHSTPASADHSPTA